MNQINKNKQIVEDLSRMDEPLSLGQLLKEKRQLLEIDLIKVSLYLKVKKSDIEAIENDNFSTIAKNVYIYGLIRSYIKFLEIDKQIAEDLISALPSKPKIKNNKNQFVTFDDDAKLSPNKEMFLNFLLISIILFLILLSLYNFYENKSNLITIDNLIHRLENIDFKDGR